MQNNINYVQEDEIDLREVFKIVWDKRYFIFLCTFIITILGVVFAYTRTPFYEIKSNIKIGYIGNELISDSNSLVKELRIVFNVDDKISGNKIQNSNVESIELNKQVQNYIEIKTIGLSNDDAIEKNKEVIEYILKNDEKRIHNIIRDKNFAIEEAKKELEYIDTIEIPDIQREIEKLKTQNIATINKKIENLKEQDIKNIEREIILINTHKIVSIEESIVTEKEKVRIIENKIIFNQEKLKEYNTSISELFNNRTSDNVSSMVSSIQMVNYQNLILNAQNKIEDLILDKNIIENQTIPNLKREKANLIFVIEDMKNKIRNIKEISIIELEKEKENIIKDSISKLQEKIEITLKDKKRGIEEKVKKLEYEISKENISTSHLVGDFVFYDYPIKPKKRLIIMVTFMTGFILSIFMAFALNFFGKNKDEIKTFP